MATRTYHGTMFNPDLAKATIRLYIYEKSKYEKCEGRKVEVTGVKEWSVVEGDEDAERIEALGVEKDQFHEYLILRYADGRTEIYPNGKVAMFVL